MLNKIKQIALIVVLVVAYQGANAADDHFNISIFSAAKKLESDHVLLGYMGNIHEEFEGKIAYLGVSKKLENDMTWALGYFGYYPKGLDGEYTEDHRARGSLSYTFKLGSWSLKHRSRLEYRMGQVANGFRYRPAFEFSTPLKINNHMVIPYAEIEPFYDFRKDHVSLTLLTAGLKIPVNKSIALKVAYMNIFLNHPSKHSTGPLIGLHINL